MIFSWTPSVIEFEEVFNFEFKANGVQKAFRMKEHHNVELPPAKNFLWQIEDLLITPLVDWNDNFYPHSMESENEGEKSQGGLRHIAVETSFYYPAFHDIPP